MSEPTPFIQIVKNINGKTGLLERDFIEKHYSPFGINRLMMRTPDGCMVAQQLNLMPEMSKFEQYRYYYEALKKNPRRFGQGVKAEKPKYLEMVMEYYNFSKTKAREAIAILNPLELEEIKDYLDEGGIQNE